MPERFVTEVINGYVERRWREVQERYDLDRSFALRFNREIFSYFVGERAYDTARLVRAGFRYRYAGIATGIPETIRWYTENRWLPPVFVDPVGENR